MTAGAGGAWMSAGAGGAATGTEVTDAGLPPGGTGTIVGRTPPCGEGVAAPGLTPAGATRVVVAGFAAVGHGRAGQGLPADCRRGGARGTGRRSRPCDGGDRA